MAASQTPIQVIRQYAPQLGLDPAAVIAYALTQGGTSWGAVGDNGSSFGPFQAHIGGAAGNRSPQDAAAWANSPEGLKQMMGMMARGWAGPRTGPDAAAFIVGPHFGRGANPASDIAKARAAYPQATTLLGGSPGAASTAAAGADAASALPAGLPQALPSSLPLTKIPGLTPPGFANLAPIVLSTLGKPPAALTNALVGASSKATDAALADVSGFKMPTTAMPKLTTPAGTVGAVPTAQGQLPVAIEGKTTKQAVGAIKLAQQYLGTPYVYGGETPGGGFDCSGLLQYVWGQQGVSIPRTSYDQFTSGSTVDKKNLQPGDAVFFTGSDPKNGLPGHVGMYLGGGQFIEAPHTGASIRISNLAGRSDYVGARRYG